MRSRRGPSRPGGNDKLIDAGNALLWGDEQPFPIEPDDLPLDRFVRRGDRSERVKLVRSDPNQAAEKHDGQGRNAPDNDFDAAGIDEVRTVAPAYWTRETTRRRRGSPRSWAPRSPA